MVTKELFADFVKEKKLRETEEKEELAQTLKTYYVEARKKEFIQCIQIYNNYYFIQLCDIQDNQGLSNGITPTLTLITYSGYHKNLMQYCLLSTPPPGSASILSLKMWIIRIEIHQSQRTNVHK